jgi:hypothetical protein
MGTRYQFSRSSAKSHPRERVSFGDKIYPDTEGHVMADERSAATMLQEIEFAPDSPLEEGGFELVWGFSCQVVVFGFC